MGSIPLDGVNKLGENKLRISEIPAIRDVFMRQFALKTKGYYNRNLLAGTYEMQQEALAGGTAAMAFQADWMLPEIARKFPDAVDSIGFFPLPSDTDEGIASLYPPKQIFVSKKGPNAKSALSLARYMTRTDSLNIWYKWNPGIPVYATATSKLFAGQEDINGYVKAGKGIVQIQLLTTATYVPDYDKICQEFLISGDADRAVRIMDERYRQNGKSKQLPGF